MGLARHILTIAVYLIPHLFTAFYRKIERSTVKFVRIHRKKKTFDVKVQVYIVLHLFLLGIFIYKSSNTLGKYDEATILMNNLLKQDTNLQSLLGSTKAEQERRMKEKLEARRKRKEAGMNEAEIEKLETEEDAKYEEENANTTSGNLLQDLEVCTYFFSNKPCFRPLKQLLFGS